MHFMKQSITAGLLSVALCTFSAQDKKVIACGFEISQARTSHLARNVDKLNQLPIDGVCIFMHLPYIPKYEPAGNKVMNSPVKWEKEWFKKEIELLKTISSGRLKHNFLNTFWSPHQRRAWNDDETWDRIAHNAAVCAWVIRQGGGDGLMMDPEDYLLQRQFFHMPQDGTYEEAAALARKRGAQVMGAIGKEYPDISLLVYMLFCESNENHLTDNPLQACKERGDLWIPFINGMLDVIPPKAKIIEGNEHSYWMNADTNDFVQNAWEMKVCYAKMAYPENQTKYRNQVSCAFAFYLDHYVSALKKSPKDQVLKKFRNNLNDALRYTDEYVWLYGEKQRWLSDWDADAKKAVDKHSSIKPETWDQKIPGFCRTIELVRNPGKVAEKQFQKGSLGNLLVNSDCSPSVKVKNNTGEKADDWKQGTLPPAWSFWPEKELKNVSLDTAVGLGDSYSLLASGVGNGSFITTIPVKSGTFYALEGFSKGNGKAYLRIRWQQKGKWLNPWANSQDRLVFFDEKPQTDGWHRAFYAFQTPVNAEKMVLLLSVRQNSNEKNHFDKISVFELDQ